ncbi:hypothetical protein ACFX11_034306 [Malus domestica]
MIKRRFYKLEHGDRDGPSNFSSSSSDSEIEPQATDDSDEEEEYDAVEQLKDNAQSCSTSSGYQSEDSSANEVPIDSSGLPITEDDDASTGHEIPYLIADQLLEFKGSSEGRLKTILNADGKIDEEKTPALYAKILANSQGMPRKKSKRQDKNGSKKRTRYGGQQSKGNPTY